MPVPVGTRRGRGNRKNQLAWQRGLRGTTLYPLNTGGMDDLSGLLVPSVKAASTLAAIFIVGLVGGFYPRALGGALNATTVRTVAATVLWLYSPALLFSVLGRTLTPALLYDAASAAAWCVLQITVGVATAFVARAIARPPSALEGFFLISIVWGNAMSLPLLLLTSLTGRGSLRDDPGAFSRAVSYVFVFKITWWCSIYSLGLELAHRGVAARAASPMPSGAAGNVAAPLPSPSSHATLRSVLTRALLQPPVVAVFVGIVVGLTPLRFLFFGESAPLSGFGDVLTLLGSGSVPAANLVLAGSLYGGVRDAVRDARAWLGACPPPEDAGAGAKLLDAVLTLVRAGWRAVGERRRAQARPVGEVGGAEGPSPTPALGAPPHSHTAGSSAAAGSLPLSSSSMQLLVVDDAPVDDRPISNAPIDDTPIGDAPMRPVSGNCSDGAVGAVAPVCSNGADAAHSLSPLTTNAGLDAAAVIALPPAASLAPSSATSELPASAARMPMASIGAILIARLFVVPGVCFAMFWAAQRAGLPMLSSDDPVLTLVVLVQAAMPSAQTLLILTSNVDDVACSKALSLLFIVQYPLACLTLVPWLMLALEMAGVSVATAAAPSNP